LTSLCAMSEVERELLRPWYGVPVLPLRCSSHDSNVLDFTPVWKTGDFKDTRSFGFIIILVIHVVSNSWNVYVDCLRRGRWILWRKPVPIKNPEKNCRCKCKINILPDHPILPYLRLSSLEIHDILKSNLTSALTRSNISRPLGLDILISFIPFLSGSRSMTASVVMSHADSNSLRL
jgi:hypothetical protein